MRENVLTYLEPIRVLGDTPFKFAMLSAFWLIVPGATAILAAFAGTSVYTSRQQGSLKKIGVRSRLQ